MTQSIEMLAREIAAILEPEPTDWTRKLIQYGIEVGEQRGALAERERAAAMIEATSRRMITKDMKEMLLLQARKIRTGAKP